MAVVYCSQLKQQECTPELSCLQSYCVGVLHAAVLSLIQDVEASALVVCTVGPTGNLIYRETELQYESTANYNWPCEDTDGYSNRNSSIGGKKGIYIFTQIHS